MLKESNRDRLQLVRTCSERLFCILPPEIDDALSQQSCDIVIGFVVGDEFIRSRDLRGVPVRVLLLDKCPDLHLLQTLIEPRSVNRRSRWWRRRLRIDGRNLCLRVRGFWVGGGAG